MKVLITAFPLLFLFQLGIAQTGVKGQLVDPTENTPIEFGNVALFSSEDSTLINGSVTAPDGTFEILEVRPGEYYLTAQFVGYETTTIEQILLSKNSILNVGPIALRTNQKMLDEIEVSGESVTMLYKVDRQVYEASKFQSGTGGTATDVLKNLPSITVDAQGQISARGTSGFVVLINGKPIQSDPQFVLNQIPANAIKNIELITAPSAKYDPEGKAGIINITTNRAATDGTFLQFNAKLGAPSIESYDNAEYAQRYGGDVVINHRRGKWDLSGGISYQRNDIGGRREGDVYTIINDTLTQFPSDGERSFDETNFSGRFTLGYTPNKNNYFSLGFFGGKRSKDRLADIVYYDNHAIFNGQRLYTMQYFNHNLRIRTGDIALGSFDYGHNFDDGSKLTTSFLYEYTLLGGPTVNQNLGHPENNLVYQDEYNTNDNPLYGIRYQLDYQSKPLPMGVLELGYQFRHLDHVGDFVYERKNNNTGVFELVPEFSSQVDLERLIHSGYAQISGKKDKLNYSVGLRIEYMDRKLNLQDKAGEVDTLYTYDFLQPYPSASLQFAAIEELRFQAAYSRRVERTTTFKMNPFREREHSETLEQGDPTLLPEFINLFELGIVKDFNANSVFATAYFRDVKNLVNRVNTIYNDTILDRIYSNVGKARSYGLEVGSETQLTDKWNLLLGGNLYNYNIEGSFDNRPVNTSSWIYSINANTTYNFSPGFNIQWTLNYISARNTAQGEDSRFFSPNLTLKKSFMNDRLSATLQWLNMDMGLLDSNEQSITTSRPGEFYTYTNYVYEVDMILLNLSFTLNKTSNKAKFIKSEFGEKEF